MRSSPPVGRTASQGRWWLLWLVPLCLLPGCSGGGGGDRPGVRVTDVIDGDTVDVQRLGRVRLIGVDTPERDRCGEDAATRFTRERLLGRVVEYELGEDPQDRYDRTLAYLSRDGQMHNLALLEEGYAQVLTIPPNDKYESEFEEAESEARVEGEGAVAVCERRTERAREEELADEPEDSGGVGQSGGGGGSCLPSSACPGRRDGDGDGCYCEG